MRGRAVEGKRGFGAPTMFHPRNFRLRKLIRHSITLGKATLFKAYRIQCIRELYDATRHRDLAREQARVASSSCASTSAEEEDVNPFFHMIPEECLPKFNLMTPAVSFLAGCIMSRVRVNLRELTNIFLRYTSTYTKQVCSFF